MALILENADANRRVWRTVKVEVPTDSGYQNMKFDVQLQLMEAEAIQDKKDDQIADFLREVIKDVRGVKAKDTDTEDLACSYELVNQLVAIPWVRTAIMHEYLLIPLGKKGALKN